MRFLTDFISRANRSAKLNVLAIAFLLAFYWRCFDIWFYQDDFGWLHLAPVGSLSEFVHSLFFAKAHGSVRVISTNAYFMLFGTVFGLNPLPFHLAVFGAAAGVLLLLPAILRRLGANDWGGFAAQMVWVGNSCVAVSLCWISIFNQTLCLFLLLAAFLCLMRYSETGQRRWLALQWVVFLLGFGALEVNVLYPALAFAWAWWFARRLCRIIAPMFAVSGAYAAGQFLLSPPESSGPYALVMGWHIAGTFWKYVEMAVGPVRLAHFAGVPGWLAFSSTVMLAGAAVWAVVRRGKAGWIAAAWFLLPLIPYLPLRDHVMDYYLTVPVAGMAMLAGLVWSRAAAPILVLYLVFNLPAAWMTVSWHRERSHRARDVVEAVVEIHRARPQQAILLTGVDTATFEAAIADLPFELYGIKNVRLAPGAERTIRDAAGLAHLYVMPPDKAIGEVEAGRAAVYDISGPRVRNVTARSLRLWKAGVFP